MGNQGSNKSLVTDLYKAFFLNDAQQNEIRIKYEQKITNIIPIISLLIRKKTQFIELVYNNCSDRIDQKDSLEFLRKEITPLIENTELLNSLTKITN